MVVLNNRRVPFSIRLQPIHGESIGARSTERQDQRGEHEAVSKAEKGGCERGGQVQSEPGRHGAGLRYLRESGRMESVLPQCFFRKGNWSAYRESKLLFFCFLEPRSQAQLNKNKFRITEGQSFR